MDKENFTLQTIVRDASDNLGVVCPDQTGTTTGPDEITVFFNGADSASKVSWETLSIVGKERIAIDPRKCGSGKGAECCKFLIVGSEEMECQRFGILRNYCIEMKGHAQRAPKKLYPNCQLS